MIDSIRKISRTQSIKRATSSSAAKKVKEFEMDNETQAFLSTLSELPEPKQSGALLEKLVINALMQNIGITNINEPKTVSLISKLKATLLQHPDIQRHLKSVLRKY